MLTSKTNKQQKMLWGIVVAFVVFISTRENAKTEKTLHFATISHFVGGAMAQLLAIRFSSDCYSATYCRFTFFKKP